MKRLITILAVILVSLVMCNSSFAQHYTDWTGFEYSPELFDSHDHVVYYELKKDYTICLAEYFEVADKLPDCCEGQADNYYAKALALPDNNLSRLSNFKNLLYVIVLNV